MSMRVGNAGLRAHCFRSRLICARQHGKSSTLASPLELPDGSWDSHMHVTDPDAFPPAVKGQYKVHKATLEQALDNSKRLKLPNPVFTQTSTYGNDNSCLLNALERMTPKRGRGVVVFDPDDYEPADLFRWHDMGVRGVRVNLKSVGRELPAEELAILLNKYADAIRPLQHWAIQLYIDLAVVPQLKPLMRQLGCKVVIDHFGSPPALAADMAQFKGWTELVQLMKRDDFYVKISAPYRFTSDPGAKALEPLFKELIDIRGGRGCVFASDWPHTRFEDSDVQPFLRNCIEWCGNDQSLVNKLFKENAEVLWDVVRDYP